MSVNSLSTFYWSLWLSLPIVLMRLWKCLENWGKLGLFLSADLIRAEVRALAYCWEVSGWVSEQMVKVKNIVKRRTIFIWWK
jgi:hypothetical protein